MTAEYISEYIANIKYLKEEDYEEFKEQLTQLVDSEDMIVELLYNAIQERKENNAIQKRKIELAKSIIVEQEAEIDEFEETLLEIVDLIGVVEDGTKNKRIEVGAIKYYKRFSVSVKSTLTTKDIPRAFVNVTLKEKLTDIEVAKIKEALETDNLKFDEVIDKKALTNYAKKTNSEEIYLEFKPYLSQ